MKPPAPRIPTVRHDPVAYGLGAGQVGGITCRRCQLHECHSGPGHVPHVAGLVVDGERGRVGQRSWRVCAADPAIRFGIVRLHIEQGVADGFGPEDAIGGALGQEGLDHECVIVGFRVGETLGPEDPTAAKLCTSRGVVPVE